MAKLTAKKRKALKPSTFAVKKKEGGKTVEKYPINDKSHARNALARVSQFGSPGEKAAVKKKVKEKFPSIAVGGKKTKKKKGK